MAQIPKGGLVKGPYKLDKPICRDCAIYFSTTVLYPDRFFTQLQLPFTAFFPGGDPLSTAGDKAAVVDSGA